MLEVICWQKYQWFKHFIAKSISVGAIWCLKTSLKKISLLYACARYQQKQLKEISTSLIPILEGAGLVRFFLFPSPHPKRWIPETIKASKMTNMYRSCSIETVQSTKRRRCKSGFWRSDGFGYIPDPTYCAGIIRADLLSSLVGCVLPQVTDSLGAPHFSYITDSPDMSLSGALFQLLSEGRAIVDVVISTQASFWHSQGPESRSRCEADGRSELDMLGTLETGQDADAVLLVGVWEKARCCSCSRGCYLVYRTRYVVILRLQILPYVVMLADLASESKRVWDWEIGVCVQWCRLGWRGTTLDGFVLVTWRCSRFFGGVGLLRTYYMVTW